MHMYLDTDVRPPYVRIHRGYSWYLVERGTIECIRRIHYLEITPLINFGLVFRGGGVPRVIIVILREFLHVGIFCKFRQN